MHKLYQISKYAIYLIMRNSSPRRPDYLIMKNTDLVHFPSTLYTFNKSVQGKKKGKGKQRLVVSLLACIFCNILFEHF